MSFLIGCSSIVFLLIVLSIVSSCVSSSSISPLRLTRYCCRDSLLPLVPRGGNGSVSLSTSSRNKNAIADAIGSFSRVILDARRHLVAAAAARSISIFGMYPIDTIKTRIQMEQDAPFRLAGMYKGVSGSLFGQVPYGVLTFGSYEVYKKTLLTKFPNMKPIVSYALAAILGDLTGSGWLCPSEVVKQQLQAGMYPSTWEAVRTIFQKKGFVGFYQGYFGGIARDVPFRVAQLTSYEITKNIYLRTKQKYSSSSSSSNGNGEDGTTKLELSSIEAAFCGAVAGSFSAAVTSPLDRIKTLLMTDSGAYGGSVVSCASKIWVEEGLMGFTTGIIPRVTYIAPSVAIFFIVYEGVQQRLQHWQPKNNNTSN